MANKKITDLTTATPATGDIIELVDISDTTDGVAGSSRKTTLNDLPISSAATTALAGKAASTHTHVESDVTGLVSDLAGKAASVHTHAESDVTGLVSDLAGKQASSVKLTAIAALSNAAGALTNDGSGNFSYVAAGGGGGVAGQNAFRAYMTSTSGAIYGSGAYLVFDGSIISNSAYSTTTGKFTAPATGVYMFMLFYATAATNSQMDTNLIDSSSTVLVDEAHYAAGYSSRVSIMIPLTIGQTVQPFLTTATYPYGGIVNSTFSGYRIA